MLKNKTKDEKKKSPYTVRSEAVTLNLKASNSTLFFCCASERKRRPPGDFIAIVSLSVPHFWAGEGGGVGFLFWEPLQLCVAGEENGLFSDNSNPRLNKGQASSLLGPVGVLYLQLKYWDALCQNVKRKNTQERLKNGGMAATTKLNHSLLGLSLPNAIFYHVEMSGEQNRETEQREQHLHVWL